MDQQALITRIRAGDPAAERALYDAHADRLYRLTYRYLGDRDAAEDCLQETFIRAFERIGDFRGESGIGSWLGAIAVTTALNALRRRKRRGVAGTLEEAGDVPAPMRREVEPDLRDRLHREIDNLPEGYRMVFLLHDVEGYTHEEIGQMLGVQGGTSKAQLFRARARLRERLADFVRD